MGLKDPINTGDAINLKSIQKKLNLPLKKLVSATAIQKDPNLTADQKTKKLLGIPDEVETVAWLEERLSEKEMITIGKFVKLS